MVKYVHYKRSYQCWELFHEPSLGVSALTALLIGVSVSEPPSSDVNGDFLYMYIYMYIMEYGSTVTEILVRRKNWSGGPKFPEYRSGRTIFS